MDEFISNLRLLSSQSSKIKNVEGVISSLQKLNSLVGVESIKKSIILQLQHFVVCQISGVESSGVKHICIGGPPGCGKTSVCTILAEIYANLGIITPITERERQKMRDDRRKKNTFGYDEEEKEQVENLLQSFTKEFRHSDKRIEELKVTLADAIEDLDTMETDKPKRLKKVITSLQWLGALFDEEKEEEEEEEEEESSPSECIVIYKRDDLIGNYTGQTSNKTRAALEEALGKVVLFDEAYTIMMDESDTFGMEALTMINEFMSLYSDKLIVIFSGYSDLMERGIFTYQPGLKRRIGWNFEIGEYTPLDLAKIFVYQLHQEEWKYVTLLEKSLIEDETPPSERKESDSSGVGDSSSGSDSASGRGRREIPKKKVLRRGGRKILYDEEKKITFTPTTESDVLSLSKIFEKEKKSFPNFGGDTLRLFSYCKLEKYSQIFKKMINGENRVDKIITLDILIIAIAKLKENLKEEKKSSPPEMMYL